MLRKRTLLAALLVAFATAACGDDIAGPSDSASDGFATTDGLDVRDEERSAVRLTVMTRNLYVGTDVDRLIGVTDPNQIPFIVADIWALLLANDADDRMAAVAAEIAAHEPHLVGLQEVSTFRTQHPADFQLNAQDVVIDFVPTLLAYLDGLGQDYRVVAQVRNMDVELPRLNPDFTLTDVRVTDYDVILARADVETSSPAAFNYAADWQLAPGIPIPRGVTAVDATIDGQTFRVVNTHPEPVETQGGAVQALQTSELVDALSGETRPTVLLGDLNTEAPGGESYDLLRAEGFLDVFDLRRGVDGAELTCCHDVDLSSDAVPLEKRIDHIMVRNFDGLWSAADAPPVGVTIVGDTPDEKSTGGLWPSDHAGVVASFVLPRSGS